MDYKAIVSKVAPGLNGIPDFVVIPRIREAVIEFCRETWCYTLKLDAMSVSEDEKEYDLSPPQDREVIAVLNVQDANEVDVAYTVADDYSGIVLDVAPASDDAFTITPKVVLIPSEDSTDFPDFIFNRFSREIIAGAKSFAHGMSDRPWSDPKQEARHWATFRRGITRMRQDKINGRRQGATVSIPSW